MAKTPKRPTTKETPEPASVKDSPVDSRLAIPLDKDGRILLDNMRETSKQKLAELMRDSNVRDALGLTPPASAVSDSASAGMALPPELMMPIVGGLSALETMLISRMTGAPADLVLRYGPYTREEREQIAPLLAAVLAKRAGGLFEKWGEESALTIALVSMTMAKVGAINAELEKRGPRGIVVPMAGQTEAPRMPEPDAPGGES